MEDFEESMSRMMNMVASAWMGGSVSEKLEIIRASETFDKTVLVKHHVRESREFEKSERKMSWVKTSVRERPSRPSVPLKGLRVIHLPDLRIGECHTGCVLHGTLCVDAFKVVGIITLMEDRWGRAVKLQIYNAAVSTSSCADVQRMYPKGTVVAVKEPYLKRAGDGMATIRIDNPRSIEFLGNSRVSPPPNHPSEGTPLEELRKRGNRCFAEEDWNGAVHFYSLCVQNASSDGASASSSRDQDILLSYSNRAEARLRLDNFEEALTDCCQALDIDPNHLKSLYRKGRALNGLQQYEEAIACLRLALQHSAHNKEIESCLEKSSRFNSQSQTGKYDVSTYLLSRRKKDIPEVGDFVGPVVVKRARDGRGRGLFITRNVEAGDLLLVTNALAVADEGTDRKFLFMDIDDRRKLLKTACEEDLIAKLVRLAASSRKAMRQLYSLADSCNQEAMEVPSMDLFKPNRAYPHCRLRGEASDGMQVDVERIRNIVRLNSIERLFPDVTGTQRAEDNSSSGLWILPSFINHSCLPNARRLQIGGAMFVHAACDIRKGQEVTAEYFDVLMPFVLRSDSCKRWEFVCNCKRCHVERSLHVSIYEMTNKFIGMHLNIQLWRSADEFPKLAAELENFLTQHGLKPEEKRWIRVSFNAAYIEAFSHPAFCKSVLTTREEYANSLKNSVPGSPPLLLVTTMMAEEAPSNKQKQKALEMAKEACVAVIGKQEDRVIEAFIRDPASVFSLF